MENHHLLRVRIRKQVFDKLQEIAEEKTASLGEHVTISDLVRAAIFNSLLVHEAARRLENIPALFLAMDDEEDVSIIEQSLL